MIRVAGATAAAVATACGFAQGSPHILRVWQEHRLRRLVTSSRRLILTYDDGPGRQLTPHLLDLLAAHRARASFFLLGRRVIGNEEVVSRIAKEGHEIGCHGQNHIHAWRSWPWRTVADIGTGYATLSPWTKRDAAYRPPYGKLSMAGLLTVWYRRAGLAWWTVDSGDTHSTLPEPGRAADSIARSGGGVVLLHDFDRGSQRENYVLRTTELLLRTAVREGLTVCRHADLWSTCGHG
jgi:peptidoglycan-N-acetylglucosamine deacetylase